MEITHLIILADEMEDLLSDLAPILLSSEKEWQLPISTVISHIGR